MIIDCIGCLHGARPKLEGGDLLIVTGDLTARDSLPEFEKFYSWLIEQDYDRKIFIGGNHDNTLFRFGKAPVLDLPGVEYLFDSGTHVEDFFIWGSPWSSRFEGINPDCCAFTGENDAEIAPYFDRIPSDVDILITHSPPFTIRDMIEDGKQVGSVSLMANHISRFKPKLWVFSHIHEGYGQDGPYQWSGTRYVNCSIMTKRYESTNAPIRILL